MKKKLSITLCAISLLFALAACSSKSDLANSAHGSSAHLRSCGTGSPCNVCCGN